jgi:hypothetical protein
MKTWRKIGVIAVTLSLAVPAASLIGLLINALRY